MADCIFCKIVDGTIPAAILYRDELVCAFLDLGPINPGHALVIPLVHHESAATIPEAAAGRMFHIAARIGVALKRAADYDGFNLHLADGAAAGQVVGHAHLHVVPRGVADGFHWNWRQLPYAAEDERIALAEAIKAKLAVRA